MNGLSRYRAGVALKRKMTFPLFNTIKVCGKPGRHKRETEIN